MRAHHAAQVRKLLEALPGPLQTYARTRPDSELARDATREAFAGLMTGGFPEEPSPLGSSGW